MDKSAFKNRDAGRINIHSDTKWGRGISKLFVLQQIW